MDYCFLLFGHKIQILSRWTLKWCKISNVTSKKGHDSPFLEKNLATPWRYGKYKNKSNTNLEFFVVNVFSERALPKASNRNKYIRPALGLFFLEHASKLNYVVGWMATWNLLFHDVFNTISECEFRDSGHIICHYLNILSGDH